MPYGPKSHNESRKSRNNAIRERVSGLITLIPTGTHIYTRDFAKSVGKVKGWHVEPTHMRVFLRERDDLVYDRNHYVKV
jgi:hypothetical protein